MTVSYITRLPLFPAAFVALGVGLLAAGQAGAADSKTLTIAISGDVETIDPPFSQFQRSNEVNYNIYDQFFRYGWKDTGIGYADTDIGKIEGSAIQSWKWSDDHLKLTLDLRKGANFTKSGRPVTADDFIYWFERAYGTKAGTQWNAVTANIKSIDQVKKLSDSEFEITFSGPSPWFFYLFRDQSQAPMDSVEAKAHATADDSSAAKWIAKNDIGSGEFSIESWEPGVQVVLKANPKFWDGPAYFDRVVLKIVPSSANRALLLQQGQVDFAKDLSTDELNLLRSASDVKVLSIPTRNQMILGFNVKQKPFDNPKVRQALDYAVPYQSVLDGIFKGKGFISEGPIPVQGQLHDKSLWTAKTDPAKAKAMLADAGYPNGFPFTLDIADGDPTIEQIAILLKDAFAQVGVDMTINKQPSAAFAEGLGKLQHQAWMRDLLWYVDDPGYTGKLFFETGAVANWMGYSSPELDKVIDALAATEDAAKKTDLA
jgi:peptide/nickel transport system substrate-binding protein